MHHWGAGIAGFAPPSVVNIHFLTNGIWCGSVGGIALDLSLVWGVGDSVMVTD